MSNQKYSGEVNLDHPVIDKRPDGTVWMHFHQLPPILLHPRIIIPNEDDDQTTSSNNSDN